MACMVHAGTVATALVVGGMQGQVVHTLHLWEWRQRSGSGIAVAPVWGTVSQGLRAQL